MENLCCTIRSWYFKICICSRTVSPQLEDNYALKCSSDNFPYTYYMSLCMENYQNYITMYSCSPITGRRSWKEKKYGTNLSRSFPCFPDLVPGIGEHWCIAHLFGQFFHTWCRIFCGWEIFRTAFWCIVVFKLRGDCPRTYTKFMVPGSESANYTLLKLV